MTKTRITLISLLALGVLAFAATPVLAKEVHVYSGLSFGSAGSGPGQFKEPAGVAVNDSTSLVDPVAGDVYVVDKGNNRVEYFNSAGVFQGEINGSATPSKKAFSSLRWIAVDNDELSESHGDVYVTNVEEGHNVIDKFSATGTYIGQITTGAGGAAFSGLEGVAVDPTGELWVYQSTKEVDNYSDAAVNAFLESREANDPVYAAGPGFAVGPKDELYAALDAEGVNDFAQFESSGGFVTFAGRFPNSQTAAAVNFSSGEVYIDYGTTVKAGADTFGSGHLTASAGVAVNSSESSALSNTVYASDAAGHVVVFSPSEVADTVAEPAAPVEKTEATLHGTVNPEGLQVQSCEFEYGTEAGVFTKTSECSTPPGKGIAPVSEQAKLEGLLAGTTYYYRLTATNANGIPGSSAEEHFATLPAVDALSTGSPAEEVTPNTAKLTGTLSPDGTDAHYYFQYGTSTNYGLLSPAPPGTDAGTVSAAVPAETTLAGLTASTTYHFRLVGVNEFGTTYGADVTFTTTPAVEAVSTGKAEEITGNTAKLTGSLSPDGTDAHYYFEYGTEAGIYSATAPVPPGVDAGGGGSPVAASTPVTGLTGNTAYHYRLVAVNAFGTTYGSEQTLTTEITPVIAAGEAREVTGSGAELRATVNPEGLGLHSCVFQYGTSTEYEHSANCEQTKKQIGHGTEPVPVSLVLSELQPNTEYHWRLVATDKNGSSLPSAGSDDHTFVYPTTTTSELPDHRSYELVTPPFKNGAQVGSVAFGFKYSIAATGSRVMATSIQCFDSEETCTGSRQTEGEPFAFTRTGGGWVTTPLAPPQQLKENTAWLASADAGTALYSAPTGPQSEDEWWGRAADGTFAALGPATPPGISGNAPFRLVERQSTADLSHLVWEYGEEGKVPFWPFDKTVQHGSLYEYAGTDNKEPFLVGVTGTSGSHEQLSTCGTALGSVHSTSGALSADGRTVYFTSTGSHVANGAEVKCFGTGANAHIEVPVDEFYARVDGESSEAHTLKISQGLGESILRGASADGSRVFFTENQSLYESACTKECEKAGEQRELIDVSAGPAGAPVAGGPRVQGVEAISSDGSHVYFVAQGTLTATPNAQGQTARSGADNLYLYESDVRYPHGHLAFIATLPNYANAQKSESGHWSTIPEANVTPDGRFLVFDSHGDLTPDTHSGGAQQIFRYDAETGELVRISVGNDGYGDDGNAGAGNAAIVPAYEGSPKTSQAGLGRGDPTMSDDGSYVFFMSPVALTPHALNDVVIGEDKAGGTGGGPLLPIYAQNVYEYHEGHVYLISDGHDVSGALSPCPNEEETYGSASCLLGSDSSGHNVFFETSDRLVSKDTDTQVDIYDARICEPQAGDPCITEPPPPLPPCGGEQCHGIPEPTPSLLAPGTATFNGEGNTAPSPPTPKVTKKAVRCKKGFVKNKKNKCVRKKSNKAKKSARKSSTNRRAPR